MDSNSQNLCDVFKGNLVPSSGASLGALLAPLENWPRKDICFGCSERPWGFWCRSGVGMGWVLQELGLVLDLSKA